MPFAVEENLPTSFPNPNYLTLTSQKRGVITLVDKSLLPKDALAQADNNFLYEEGQAGLRPGVDWFGTTPSTGYEIMGFDYFDFDGVVHLVCATNNGKIWRSTNDGDTWTECTGATLTSDYEVNFNQNSGYLYITSGAATDNIIRYDGSTTLAAYTSLTTPTAPSAVETGLGTGSAYNYYYKVARVNTIGFSIASPKNTGTVSSNLERTSWDSTTNFITLTTPTGEATQTRWDIYISNDDLNYYYLSSVPSSSGVASTWVDNGTAIPVPSTLAPTGNTSQGPKVAELTNVGSRQFGVRDADNRYRIWFTGAGADAGSFSSAYDGGYLDWQEGGKLIPMVVRDYRDGKGTPLATIWCDSADGQGGILQMSLETLTIGDVSVTIPSAYLLPGSRGTPAPGSVVNVLNDYFFYNSQAVYNLGSRAQFLNLLSTDEASANIRPTIKQVSVDGERGIASVYSDARVYLSVAYGASQNNATAVYDTERKAWLPYAFTIGFKKFLRYTTTDGARKLLCLKPGDERLSEIGENIRGDYGVPFISTLMTGLYPVSKNRFEFQWTEQGECEFSNPSGSLQVELIGIERSRGFTTQGTTTITTQLIGTGHDTFLHDTRLHDDTSDAIDTFSESSVKRYFRLGRELNAVQWRVTTSSIDAGYVLRTLQTWGTETRGGLPRIWRLDRN